MMDVVFVKYVIEHYHTTGPLFTNETCSLFDGHGSLARRGQKNLQVGLILQDSWAPSSNRLLVSSARRSVYLRIAPR
jgi:hypothetical protein